MVKLYVYTDIEVTMRNWLSDVDGHNDAGHNDFYLFNAFLKHPDRVFDAHEANVFIIGMPMVKSFRSDSQNHTQNMKTAMAHLRACPHFIKNQGKDHILIAAHWFLSAWSIFFKDHVFRKEFQEMFQHCTSLRYLVLGKSIWTTPSSSIISKVPSLFCQQWEITRKNIIVPFAPYVPINYAKNWLDRKHLMFYIADLDRKGAHGSTEIRHCPVKVFKNADHSYVRCAPIDRLDFCQNIKNSKFVLVVRGDDPGSHHFINGISAGCIPIIISDLFEYSAAAFHKYLPLNDYAYILPEHEFLKNAEALYSFLTDLTLIELEKKLNSLYIAQRLLLIGHNQSETCNHILKEFIGPHCVP